MAVITEITEDHVMVKFNDGSTRKYLKANFAYEPKVDRKVYLNNYGMLIDSEKERERRNKRDIIIIIIVLLIGGTILYLLIRGAINVGNGVASCLQECSKMG